MAYHQVPSGQSPYLSSHEHKRLEALEEMAQPPWWRRWGPNLFTAAVMVLTTLALIFQDTVRSWILQLF